MKRTHLFLFSAFLFFFCQSTKAQWGIKLFYGYGFGIMNSDYRTKTINSIVYLDHTEPTMSYSNTNQSLGEGSQAGLTINYNFRKKPNFSVGMGIYYTHGKELKAESSLNYEFDYNKTYFARLHATYSIKGRMISLVPFFGYDLPIKRFHFYTEIGPNISLIFMNEYTDMLSHVNITGYWPLGSISSNFRYNRNVTIGGSAVLGMHYELADGFSIFTEARGTFIYYFPKSGSFVEYLSEGYSKLDKLTTSAKEVEFTREHNSNFYDSGSESVSMLIVATDFVGSAEQSDYRPTKMTGKTYSFSNVSVNLGFKIRLGQ